MKPWLDEEGMEDLIKQVEQDCGIRFMDDEVCSIKE